MAANPNWARWLFASTADVLKTVATNNNLAVLVEHLDERNDAFMKSSDRAEIRITGPFSKEISKGYHRILLDVNVLLTSRYDGPAKNQYNILKFAGLFHGALSMPIPVWNYGGEAGDYDPANEETQIFLGCLLPKGAKSDLVKVFNFGQTNETDKLKQSVVDARYEMYITE
ncbi:MAG: hypothetical protein WD005_05070 [Haliea sp.]